LGLAKQTQQKALLLLVQLYQKTGHIGPKYLLTTPNFHFLFEVESNETISSEYLQKLVNTEGCGRPMAFYSTLSRATPPLL
jgi:hypothetical protein